MRKRRIITNACLQAGKTLNIRVINLFEYQLEKFFLDDMRDRLNFSIPHSRSILELVRNDLCPNVNN